MWASLTSLKTLSLGDNRLSGELQSCHGQPCLCGLCPSLLSEGLVGPVIVLGWCERYEHALAASDFSISCSDVVNLLAGTLPPEWSELTELSSFSAPNNYIAGTEPLHEGLYHSERRLTEAWSSLTCSKLTLSIVSAGTLPDVWRALQNVENFNLEDNCLDGASLISYSRVLTHA